MNPQSIIACFGISVPRAFMKPKRWMVSLLLAILWGCDGSALRGQTILLSETFEPVFPAFNGWLVGDSNAASGLAYWDDVNTSFGTVPAHNGSWKGYCAGFGNVGTTVNPLYTNNMRAVMSKDLDFTGFTGANLEFWYALPSGDPGWDFLRVYIDQTNNLLFSTSLIASNWTKVTAPLNAFLGSVHTLRIEFATDTSVIREGAYVDDITVRGANQPVLSSLQSLSNINYSGYVLDSDTFLGRSNIQAQTQVQLENFSGGPLSFTNVMSYRLINASNNAPHPIYGLGNAVTNTGYVYNITNIISLPAGTNLIVTNLATLRPAARLNQFAQYYVECQMLTNGVLVQTRVTQPTNFYHFTNTLGSDAAYNALVTLDSAGWSQTYAVQSIPGQDAFGVDVNYTIRRWDDLGLGIASASVPVVFSYTLRDQAGTVIPLVSSNQTFFESVNSYGIFFFTFPVVSPFSRTLSVKPSIQLDSVARTYYLTVSASHTNNPVGSQVLFANARGTTTNEVLHFNGNLRFGTIGTTMTGLGFVPPVNPPSGGVIPTTLSGVNGYVTAQNTHTYSGAGPLAVNLLSSGLAVVTGGSAVLNAPVPDSDVYKNVRFERGPIVLTSAGTTASILVTLPTGFGYRTNDFGTPIVYPRIQFFGVPLNAALDPAANQTFLPGVPVYTVEESKPVWMETDRIVWRVAEGKFEINPTGAQTIHVRNAEYAYLSSVSNLLVSPPQMGDKRSNDKYWNQVAGVSGSVPVVTASGQSNATLEAFFKFNPGGFRTHFPYDSSLRWNGPGGMKVADDAVVHSASGLTNPTTIRVVYTRDCPDCGGGGAGNAAPPMTSSNAVLTFTTDGGLVAGGPTSGLIDLQWGYIATKSDFAQSALDFAEAGFHMPGNFVRGDLNLLPTSLGAATILYTGFAVSNLNVVERPLSSGYSAGLADYAGMNFRCLADNDHVGRSTIAGQVNINWKLTGRSKYYLRPGGITGIHEAVAGSFPTNLTLWGYQFTFSNYGLSYRDSLNVDSRTDGAVDLPYPSDFVQDFEKMKFSCLGAPLNAELPGINPFKVMSYWGADFKTQSIQFKGKNGCDPTDGYLVLGIQGYASHVDKPLYGFVGFFNNGDHIPKSFGLEGVDSRLKIPNVIKFSGANKTEYAFTPISDSYYNQHAGAPPAPTAGWMNIYGKLNVPFFEDMQLHLQTSCHTNGVAASNAPINLSGGWPRAGSSNPNHGWLDGFNRTPFQTNFFDWNNTGWPGPGGGLTIEHYRDNTGEDYHPRAQRLWLGVVDFDYPMSWNSTLRSFKSWQERTNDLLVLKVQHQVKYMDAKQAEIDFGAQYDGLPSISIANIAFNAIDEATGVGSALVQAATQPVFDVLNAGLDELGQMLDTQMNRLMDGVFDRTIDPIIDNWYGALSNQWSLTWNTLSLAQKQQFIFSVQTNATNFFIGGSAGAVANNLSKALRDVGSAVSEANNLIGQIEGYLRDATNAICAVAGTLSSTTNGLPIAPVTGLIAKTAGERLGVPKLAQSLVGEIAPQFIEAVAGPTLSNLVHEIEPALTEITTALNQVKDAISIIETQLHSAGNFTTELDNTIKSLSAELTNVSIQVSLSLTQYFGQLNYAVDNPFQHLSADEIKKFARQKVEDFFFATTAAAQVQTILRQRLYDLDAAMRSQIDTVFQSLNGMLRDLISQSLAELDNTINEALGDISDVMGAGQINGHALIEGDSLKCLRLDAHFEWKAPDAMEFDAFLQIKELDSDGSAGCSSPSGSFTEVTLGASHIPFDWISPDLSASIQVKFTFDGTVPFPVNFAGQLELDGDLSFEAFVLHDLAAAVAFGKYENYLALKGGVGFNGYDFSGAIFFGRTCSLDPLLLIDPDVAGVLGNPPFTGAYVYAQGWLPISEMLLGVPASCLFEISAGVGAGAFYFAEGPTYGGKMFLGVHGELLCIVSITGEITLIGLKSGDDLRFKGHGHFEAEIGPCPFCISVSKDVDVSYVNKSWHID